MRADKAGLRMTAIASIVSRFKRVLSTVQFILLVLLIPLVSGIVKLTAPPTWWPAEWRGLFAWVVENQWLLIPGTAVIAAALTWLLDWAQRTQQAQDRKIKLQRLARQFLERMRLALIPGELGDDPPPDHRLTLFRSNAHQTRLEIVARSGEATSGSRTTFAIDPDDVSRCEGVAGVGWFRDHTLFVPSEEDPRLPDLSQTGAEVEIEDYARRTFVDIQRAKKERWRARSFAAVTIRIDGRRWGVLVLDSVDPDGARPRIIKRERFAIEMLTDMIKEHA